MKASLAFPTSGLFSVMTFLDFDVFRTSIDLMVLEFLFIFFKYFVTSTFFMTMLLSCLIFFSCVGAVRSMERDSSGLILTGPSVYVGCHL